MQGKLKKRLNAAIIALVAFAVVFFLLRGPYLSNSIKRVIIPVLENATGESVIIDSAVINLFPFYIQAKGFKVFDREGNRLLWITKTRIYADLLGLLSKEIRVRKLTIKEPDLSASEKDIRRIIEHIKKNTSAEKEQKYRFSLLNVELADGKFDLTNARGMRTAGSGLFFQMTTKDAIYARLRIDEAGVRAPDLAPLQGKVSGRITMKEDRIDIAELNITSAKSYLDADGYIDLAPEGELKGGSLSGSAEIHEEAFRLFFDLKSGKDGVLSFKGKVLIEIDGPTKEPRFTLDVKTDSSFYLESLMEMVKVKENITGKLSVKGQITGTYPELSGNGSAQLSDAILGGLHIDDLDGDVRYEKNIFTLKDFTAHTYGGEMKGVASLSLPNADYTVEAGVSNISSPEFFRFIQWEPPFPAGRIGGNFLLKHIYGNDMDIVADLNYKNVSGTAGNVLDRLSTIKTRLHLKENNLQLDNTLLSTAASTLTLNGNIDFRNKMMGLAVQLDSRDISDVTAPYYEKFIAPAKFKGSARGTLEDPEISGSLETGSGSIHGMTFTHAAADLTYRIHSLSVPKLNITSGRSSYDVSGTIDFKKAEGLFSFAGPFYKGKASVRDAELKPFISVFYEDIPVSGTVNGTASFTGSAEDFAAAGDLVIRDSAAYGQQFDKLSVKAGINPDHVEFHSVDAQRGESLVRAKGKLFYDRKFTLSASSRKISLSDVDQLQRFAVGGSTTLDIQGSGTIDKPDIKFSANIMEGTFRGMQAGKGTMEGRLQDRDLSARGIFLDGHVIANAKASLSRDVKWNIDADILKGSYDFLLSGYLKKPPEDLALSFEGKLNVSGEGGRISMQSRFNYLHCDIYGYNLNNAGDIVLELANGELSIKSFSLAGDHARLTAGGVLKKNEQLNVKIKGNMSISPLKILSDKFVALKGQGDFAVDITGPWDKPDVTGEINMHDAVASLTEYPYKVGPVNGTVFLQKDRFTFDSVKTAFGGGSITISGVGYLKGVSVKRVFLNSEFSGITLRPMDKVSATVDGRLFYEKSGKGSSLTGNLDIKKARYEKNIDWNKWLVNVRDMNRETVRYPAFLKDTEFNVYISGSDNITIANNIAKTPVEIALTLTGTIARPGLIGRVVSKGGKIYFRSNEFTILEGSNVDFIDPHKIVPVFHILAETYADEYYVKLNLDGAIDKFTLSLFSDPPLNEMEILNLLTFGQARRESKGIESGLAASEAASILTGGLQDVVQEQFRSITGFERFKIEPNTTSTGGLVPKITIGKRLFEDNLFVIYTTSFGTTEESIIKLEYRIDKNISLVGSKDAINSIGGDVKFRFEFK
ncbi:MAG: hypothetical protein C4538_05555 [Nitrospiraceae bacterium]|nr:MAG: hypothetical protein C4538_05555 [Nitrospiraceae bacterium]